MVCKSNKVMFYLIVVQDNIRTIIDTIINYISYNII